VLGRAHAPVGVDEVSLGLEQWALHRRSGAEVLDADAVLAGQAVGDERAVAVSWASSRP
jgi:hypothetical protein